MNPCRNGHTSGRYKNGRCIECAKARAAIAYRKNPIAWRTRGRLWERKAMGMPEPTRPCPKVCECCGGKPNGQGGTLHLDHDHITGKFRGWICMTCNTGIGKLGDTIMGVSNALTYLVRAL